MPCGIPPARCCILENIIEYVYNHIIIMLCENTVRISDETVDQMLLDESLCLDLTSISAGDLYFAFSI